MDESLAHLRAMLAACERQATRDGVCWICWAPLVDVPPHVRGGHSPGCCYVAARAYVDGSEDIHRPPEFTTEAPARGNVRSSA